MENKVITYDGVKRMVWSILNILTSGGLSSNYNAIAFLLFLKGENITDKITWRFESDSSLSVREAIDQTISDFHYCIKGDIAEKLANIFSNEISNINKVTLHQIIELLAQIDNEVYQNYSSVIIDDIYLEIARLTGKRRETYIQPKEITKLIDSLIELPVDAHVYNPFAGLASYGVSFNHSYTYYGQELNQIIWALGIIRLIAHGVDFDNYLCEDSIHNWENGYSDYIAFSKEQNKKFDLVVSTPPFGVRLDPMTLNSNEINARTAEDFLMIKGPESINSDGKFVLVASSSVLTKGGNSLEIRKNLIENDLLEMVVTLPYGLFEATSITTSILIFNKKKKSPNFVKFVNGESFFIGDRLRKTLNIDKLLELINSNIESDFLRVVSNSLISETDFNFNPARYLYKEQFIPSGYKVFKLNEIITPIQINSRHNDISGRYIQISDLSSSPVDCEKTFSDIENQTLSLHSNKLTISALLISRIAAKLKPTFYRSINESPLHLNPNILAFSVDEKIVDISYLVNELYSDFVQNQLGVYATSGVIPQISSKQFLNLDVLVPSIQIQKEKVADARKKIILSKEQELFELRGRYEHQSFEEFASLKHALGKPIPGITTSLEYIFNYLQENEGKPIFLNSVVSNRRNITLNDKFSVALKGLDLIRTLLKKGDSGLILDQYPKVNIKIVQFIREFCESFDSEKFKINIYDENKTIDDIEILANNDLLRILLNDILSNANNHAFKDSNVEKNEVAIFLSILDNNFYLKIANNGNPFPSNFNHEKFIQKFKKSDKSEGAGIGGYDINRIAQYCNGKFQLITEGTIMEGYNSIYSFNFPLINAKEDEQYDV
jgi:type I restriction enzyme M protein